MEYSYVPIPELSATFTMMRPVLKDPYQSISASFPSEIPEITGSSVSIKIPSVIKVPNTSPAAFLMRTLM